MSQENLDLVEQLMASADVDLVPVVRDDDLWAAATQAVASVIHPDVETVGTAVGGEGTYVGVDGFRDFMLDWLAPWGEYRSEVAQIIDRGDQVVAIYRMFGRREGSAHEVEGSAAWIWTIVDGKVARIVGYAEPHEALKAVGLEA